MELRVALDSLDRRPIEIERCTAASDQACGEEGIAEPKFPVIKWLS
jgi:hypothetical protein